MDSANIGPIITALAVLVTAITALISVIRNGQKLDVINHQTNGQLDTLHAKVDAAIAVKATDAELAARPAPPPAEISVGIHP